MRLDQRETLKRHHSTFVNWVSQHRRLLYKVGGGLAAVLILVQLFYPAGQMPLFATVDGVSVGGWDKADAVRELDKRAANQRIAVSLGKVSDEYATPLAADMGVAVSNQVRIDQATYPWYLRLIPTSLVWFGLLQKEQAPQYAFDEVRAKEYLNQKIGEGCVIPAKDATLKLTDEALTVVPAKSGGSCDEASAVKVIGRARPRIDTPASVTIPVTVIAPAVGDDAARRLADTLNDSSRGGIRLKVADKTQVIAQKEILSWLAFKPGGDGLTFEINPDKANAYLAKTATPVIAKPAGVTKVTTEDFTETSRQEGAAGQTLDLGATLADISLVLSDDKDQAKAQVTTLAPKVEYTRSYTKTSTGIAALMKFYDDDNAGVFGVSFAELGGQGLNAQHNGDRQFVTASTYKLFVAFSTLKRVEAGQLKWDDANIAGGRDLAKCFDDMIVKSDNPCAEELIKKIGAKDLNADIKSLGLNNTAFRASNNVTTANDLSKYMTLLEKGSMPLKPEHRERLIGALKRNVYRQGVPAGASGPVADKVGFLWALLHDATIVYSPKGTYVLVVMTDGSSWANIADLTRKIEALR